LTDATPKFKFVLGAFWTMSRWSVNLREEIYGPSSQWVSLNGSGVGGGASHLMIGTAPITDVDIGYSITDGIKLDVGANNLFDKKPPTVPTIDNGGNLQPADGNNVYGEPDQFSPYGINGGYYYGRITVAL
jgi:iron complex outermembrane receptor protein